MKFSSTTRCLNHPAREAVARCPDCGRFFCRECISEHDDRVLCARCLARGAGKVQDRHAPFAAVLRYGAAIVGITIAWWFFDMIGRGLILLPASVHEGTVWEKITSDE